MKENKYTEDTFAFFITTIKIAAATAKSLTINNTTKDLKIKVLRKAEGRSLFGVGLQSRCKFQ